MSDGGEAGSSGASGSGEARPVDGPSGLEPCPTYVPDPDAGVPISSPPMLGLEPPSASVPEARVTAVTANRLELSLAPGDATTFHWRGPALDSVFAVDDEVELDVSRFPFGFGSPPVVTTVRSTRATAVTASGTGYKYLRWEAGSTATITGLEPGMPTLRYGVVSCCAEPPSAPHANDYSCDYSDLVAQLDGSSARIAAGDTGTVGPWSITNVVSRYSKRSESYWYVEVSLLGPAMPQSTDGGI